MSIRQKPNLVDTGPEDWPTSFRIKSRMWSIEYVPRCKDEGSEDPEDPDNDLLGETRVDLRRVRVSLDQSLDSMRDTLVHELMHCFYSSMPGADHEEKIEEAWVEGATEAFMEIVRNSESPWWLE